MIPGKGKAPPPIETVPVEPGGAPVDHAGNFEQAWQNLRADESLQFAPVEAAQPDPPPDWLLDFLKAVGEVLAPVGRLLVSIWPVLMWVLIGAAVLAMLWFAWRLIDPATLRRRERTPAADAWMPDRVEALALLEEADRLAAEGRYDEATHLLLQRSVGQIAAARPDIVEPSSTARELSAEPRLPDAARSAFAVIAGRVERSLFALVRLSQDDWQAARDAYAEFAFQQRSLAA